MILCNYRRSGDADAKRVFEAKDDRRRARFELKVSLPGGPSIRVYGCEFPTLVLLAAQSENETSIKAGQKLSFNIRDLKLSTKLAQSSASENIGPERAL